MEENEIELMDYLNIVWKRKWLIIIPTFLCIIIAIVVSFLLPQKWEIDALIMPSKFFVKTERGQFEEVVVDDPKQIAGQINQASYNSLIAAELNLDIREFPKLKAENIRETHLVRVSIRERDVKKAKSILHSLFKQLKRELDEKSSIEMKGIDTQIKSKEIDKLSLEKEIRALRNKLNIVKQRKKEIGQEISETRNGIKFLEDEHRLILKKERKSEAENLAMLLYSNEIQQSLRYHNTLNELLSIKKIEEENINLETEIKGEKIKQIENEISNLNERKGRIDFTKLIKEPTSSLYPVSPRTKLNVLISGILGFLVFTLLAFFIEYLEKQKSKRKS